jgi:hypothetical protein
MQLEEGSMGAEVEIKTFLFHHRRFWSIVIDAQIEFSLLMFRWQS